MQCRGGRKDQRRKNRRRDGDNSAMTDRQSKKAEGEGGGGAGERQEDRGRLCNVMAPICQAPAPPTSKGRPGGPAPAHGAAPTPHASHPLPSCQALRTGPCGCLRDYAWRGAPRHTHGGGGAGGGKPSQSPGVQGGRPRILCRLRGVGRGGRQEAKRLGCDKGHGRGLAGKLRP